MGGARANRGRGLRSKDHCRADFGDNTTPVESPEK
jgi:hypothetical protein